MVTSGSERVTAEEILRLIAGVVRVWLLELTVFRELEVLVKALGADRPADVKVGGRKEERGTMVKLEGVMVFGKSPLRRHGGVGRVEFRWGLLERRGLLRPRPEFARLCRKERESLVSMGVWLVA